MRIPKRNIKSRRRFRCSMGIDINVEFDTTYTDTWNMKTKSIRFGYYTPKRFLSSTNTPQDGEPKAFDTIYPGITYRYLVWNVGGQFRYHIQHGQHGKANFSSTYARSMQTRLSPFRKSRRWRLGWFLTGQKQSTPWGGEGSETNQARDYKLGKFHKIEAGKTLQLRVGRISPPTITGDRTVVHTSKYYSSNSKYW